MNKKDFMFFNVVLVLQAVLLLLKLTGILPVSWAVCFVPVLFPLLYFFLLLCAVGFLYLLIYFLNQFKK